MLYSTNYKMNALNKKRCKTRKLEKKIKITLYLFFITHLCILARV